MGIYDFAFVTGQDGEVVEVLWNNPVLRERYGYEWKTGGKDSFRKIWPESGADGREDTEIDGETYACQKLALPGGETVWLFSRRDRRQALLEKAFEEVDEGIQIYDQEGYLLYCNENSRKISTIPDSMDIIGKHMLDIWKVEEEKSAVLSCLKVKAPVKNRVDTFASVSAGDVTTVNSAYPLACGGKIEGAVLFERDAVTVEKRKKEFQAMTDALDEYVRKNPSAHLSGYTFEQIIGESGNFRNAVELAEKFAPLDCNILLIGETGTGKEMFAQSIHRKSPRGRENFVAVNCAALPETLIESMLFGTTKGAFTGSENRAGLFEEAHGGTLFLDELNSMSLMMQSKILRVIQEGAFRRIGGSRIINADVRIISSCNEDPFAAIEEGKMRRDLFYRLSSVQIIIPPLRERISDLELLIEHYISLKRRHFAKTIAHVSDEVMELFREYDWPGNVRELYHVLDYAMNVMEGGEIHLSCIPVYLTQKAAAGTEAVRISPGTDIYHTKLEYLIGDYEAQLLRQVLEYYGNNISHAAKSLGICRQSLSYRLRKYGIEI